MNLDELRKEYGPKEPNPLDQFPSEKISNHIIPPKEAARMLSDGLCKGPVESVGGRLPLNYNHIQPHDTTPCAHGVYDCKEQHEFDHLGEWSEYSYIDNRFDNEMDMATFYWIIGIIMLLIYPIAYDIARAANRPLY